MIRENHTFDTEAEAKAFAAKFTRDYYGYNGLATTYQSGNVWKVDTVRWSSCD